MFHGGYRMLRRGYALGNLADIRLPGGVRGTSVHGISAEHPQRKFRGTPHRAKLVRGYPRDLREASVLDMGIPMDVQCYTPSGVSVSGYLEEL